MYEQFYGLETQPFELTPNPRYLLLTPTHREALSTLEYGITARKGITLLVGEAGTGKSTLVRKALAMKLAGGRNRSYKKRTFRSPRSTIAICGGISAATRGATKRARTQSRVWRLASCWRFAAPIRTSSACPSRSCTTS